MVHLLQLFTTLLLLSHAKLEGAELKVIPASLNVWNIIGDKINFVNRVLKNVITSQCNQTQSKTDADKTNTTGFLSSTSTHDYYPTNPDATTPEGLSNFTNTTTENTEAVFTNTSKDSSTPAKESTSASMETNGLDSESMESSGESEEDTELTDGSMETTELTKVNVESSESTSDSEETIDLTNESTQTTEPTSENAETTEIANESVETSETISDNATADSTRFAATTTSAPNTTTQVTRDINDTEISTTTAFYESAEQCNKAAHFDVKKGVCVCNNPEMDGKKRNPIKYREYSEGDVCYSCQDPNSTTAVVFILDEGGVVKESGWNAQKNFMQHVLDLMGDIQVGIVVIAGNSYVAVPLDDYRKNKEVIDVFLWMKDWGNTWTSTGVALYRARKMLEDSTADRKNIIIFSDGDKDACYYDDPDEDCPQWKKDYILAHPQEAEARAIHEMGINVTFVAVNFKRSSSRILKIAGKPENVVKIRTFTDFSIRTLNSVINLVCKAEMLTEE